ncbi:unnamed protein product [Rangifer tarandus platyrhynchus]|uniref:Uncharacterized protein n=2 Tax=Rangifer tarandus platyrhynchus TaxID=3082113 RepID=A0ACB0F2F2_RANTA|nr:unnamed protein product [Rangifer tarandus platyrhynchus]CAI9706668.1 unnamed protein product [Rangifer tarandus platyrhynchus]
MIYGGGSSHSLPYSHVGPNIQVAGYIPVELKRTSNARRRLTGKAGRGQVSPPSRNRAAGGGVRREPSPPARPLLGAAEAPPPAARSRRRRVPAPSPAPSRPRALAPSHRGRARCACREAAGAWPEEAEEVAAAGDLLDAPRSGREVSTARVCGGCPRLRERSAVPEPRAREEREGARAAPAPREPAGFAGPAAAGDGAPGAGAAAPPAL